MKALFFCRYIFLIAIVLSCQQSKPRTGQSGCDAVLTVPWAHSSKSARAKGMISSCMWLRDYSQRAPTCPCIEPSFELCFNPSRALTVPVTESRRNWGDAAVSSTVPFQVLWDTGRGEWETFSVTLGRLLSFCMPHIKWKGNKIISILVLVCEWIY